MVRRARIILLLAAGRGPSAVADELRCSKQTVVTWRKRYRSDGIAGLRDAPRSGRPTTIDTDVVIARTLRSPPLGSARWSTRLLAAELGISNVAVANVWRSWGITPTNAGGVRLNTDPVLDAPISMVAGLHVDHSVRLIAVVVGTSHVAPDVPMERRPDPATQLADILADARPGVADSRALAVFLDRLGDRVSSTDGLALRLVVDGSPLAIPCWAQARAGLDLHTVPPPLAWARVARVTCLLIGATTEGGASVAALQSACDGHQPGGPISWLLNAVPQE